MSGARNADESLAALTPTEASPHVRTHVRMLDALRRRAAAIAQGTGVLTIGAVAVGLGLRIHEYVYDRSLNVDESMLALNLIERSPGRLLQTLDFNQAAPPGFLLASRGVADVLGYSEQSLRALPFVAGLISLLLFPRLAGRFVSRGLVPAAIAIFAVTSSLIYYQTDFKQYSLDVVGALGLYLLVFRVAESRSARAASAVGLGGAVLIFFSHAALFVTASIAAVLVVRAVLEKQRDRVRPLLALILPWAAAALFIVVYTLPRTSGLRESVSGQADGGGGAIGAGGAASHSLSSLLSSPGYFGGTVAAMLSLPRAEPWSIVTKLLALVVVAGAIRLLRRSPVWATALLLPIPLVYCAYELDLYATFTRTLLFVLPAVIVCAISGVELLARAGRIVGPVIAAAVLATLLAIPAVATARDIASPGALNEIRPTIEYLRRNWRPGDVLYLHYDAQYGFLYYLRCGCLDVSRPGPDPRPLWRVTPGPGGSAQFAQAFEPVGGDVRLGTFAGDDRAAYLRQLDALPPGRTWIVQSGGRTKDEETFLTGEFARHLDTRGTRIAAFTDRAAQAYLYYLTKPPGPAASATSRQG